MEAPSALFQQYEADYCQKSTSVSKKLPTLEGLAGEARRKRVHEVEVELKSAEDVLKRMDMEARSLPVEQSKPLLIKVKEYRADLGSLKDHAKQASKSTAALGDAARAELGLAGDYYSTSAGQRERMLSSTQRLEKSSDHLHHGREQLIQTEELGASILRDLHSQRETIMHSKSTLQGTDDNITKARKILSSMSRRMLQNKIIMAGVILFLLLGIILMVYAKLH
uniref:Vesicle transport v-SNARE N-terminal domain-containing protein n=1 Tax=Dunaliella tertiolecta TaxID=3047 RepID=A0A7S3QKG3_DUNTE|mmetsp:Transcript_18466/g.51814  ORF Transcript_18466/g.51814 Transcript_18466/m.51814 type:complete len:224 (-) Transcript_18466:371-1042(-)